MKTQKKHWRQEMKSSRVNVELNLEGMRRNAPSKLDKESATLRVAIIHYDGGGGGE
jgi:hypothetical protein